jgi:hypothetical protein
VLTHVFGEVLDTLTKKRYLEVSTASVTFVQLVVGGINFGICTHGNVSFRPAPCQSALVREAAIKQNPINMQDISGQILALLNLHISHILAIENFKE